MSLIITYTNDVAGKQARLLDTKRRQLTQQFQNNLLEYETDMEYMWTDDSNLTVAQKFAAFGTDAASLFPLATASATFLVTVDPSYSPPTPATYGWTQATDGTVSKTFIVNSDGTVTINP